MDSLSQLGTIYEPDNGSAMPCSSSAMDFVDPGSCSSTCGTRSRRLLCRAASAPDPPPQLATVCEASSSPSMPSAPSGSQASDALPRTGQDAEGLRRDIRALENRAQILEGAVGAQAEVEVESTCRRAPRVQCGGCAACFGPLLSAFFHEPRPSRGLQQDVNALKDRLGRLESALAMQESERPNSGWEMSMWKSGVTCSSPCRGSHQR